MADSIYTFDPTPNNNTSLDSIPYGANQLYHNQIDNLFRAIGAKLAEFVDDLGAVNTVGGTGDAVTVTLASEIAAYATGQLFRFIAGAANTGAATMNVNSIGAKAIRKISGGTDVALSAGDIAAGETYLVIYRSTANSSNGGWVLVGGGASAIPYTLASASGAASLQFAEDTDNGSNKVTLQGPASTADITVTLPAEAGTVVVGSASSTDNNIPRFDGTLGKLQAGSGLAISDTFAITAAAEGGAEGTKYPAFLCRAWGNFNGTGTPAFRGSGNMSSITDNGAGDYTLNMTTALPDANYAISGSCDNAFGAVLAYESGTARTSSAFRIRTLNSGGTAADTANISVQVFR